MSAYWISDTGVRYGISTEGDAATGDGKTLAALGLTASPLPIPSAILAQFAAGPTMSRADALLAQDSLQSAVVSVVAKSAPVAVKETS